MSAGSLGSRSSTYCCRSFSVNQPSPPLSYSSSSARVPACPTPRNRRLRPGLTAAPPPFHRALSGSAARSGCAAQPAAWRAGPRRARTQWAVAPPPGRHAQPAARAHQLVLAHGPLEEVHDRDAAVGVELEEHKVLGAEVALGGPLRHLLCDLREVVPVDALVRCRRAVADAGGVGRTGGTRRVARDVWR